MPQHSGPDRAYEALRAKIIGLGERSIRKSYYPELQQKVQTLGQMNELLEQRVEQRTAELAATNEVLKRQILERQRVEDSLQQVLGELRDFYSIVSRSPAVVFRWRLAAGWPVEFVSDSIGQFGYAPDDLSSGHITWTTMIAPEDRPRLVDELQQQFLQGQREFSQEYRLIAQSGAVHWVESHNLVLLDPEGSPTHIQGILLDVTERKRAADELRVLNQALEERACQLRALAWELTTTEERERRRLAQVLHDHVQQLLVAAKLQLSRQASRLQDAVVRQSLQQTIALIDQSLAEARVLTTELSPPVLYDAGLSAGLEWLARQTFERHRLPIRLEVDADAAAAAKDIAILLFQIVRELLFNIVKHARADSAEVRLTRLESDRIQIVVADHGIGFDPAKLGSPGGTGTFGLFSIRERLSFLGGRLFVDASPGKGTQMVIEVPISTPVKEVGGAVDPPALLGAIPDARGTPPVS